MKKAANYEGGEVRVENSEPWWVAKDVCGVLGISDPRTITGRLDEDEWNLIPLIDARGIAQETYIISDLRTITDRLDEDERGLTTVVDKAGNFQETYIISESGLYAAIGRSNKPAANGVSAYKPFDYFIPHPSRVEG